MVSTDSLATRAARLGTVMAVLCSMGVIGMGAAAPQSAPGIVEVVRHERAGEQVQCVSVTRRGAVVDVSYPRARS